MIPEGLSADLLEWTWTTVPTSPFTFTYTLNVPSAAVGDYQLSTMVEVISQGTTLQGHITPEPLILTEPVTRHSADYDEDFAINLSELLRVIELYNTRFGTSRTGRYQSVTVVVNAQSRAQLDAIYRELSGHPGVAMVL